MSRTKKATSKEQKSTTKKATSKEQEPTIKKQKNDNQKSTIESKHLGSQQSGTNNQESKLQSPKKRKPTPDSKLSTSLPQKYPENTPHKERKTPLTKKHQRKNNPPKNPKNNHPKRPKKQPKKQPRKKQGFRERNPCLILCYKSFPACDTGRSCPNQPITTSTECSPAASTGMTLPATVCPSTVSAFTPLQTWFGFLMVIL